jgi:non-ribosomal peptide synthetase component E (peptide arylation enzyme)
MRFIPPGVIFMEELPLTSAGEVKKKWLRADYV